MNRIATVERNTKETQIKVSVSMDTNDGYNIDTGIGFFDHMLIALSAHSGKIGRASCRERL